MWLTKIIMKIIHQHCFESNGQNDRLWPF